MEEGFIEIGEGIKSPKKVTDLENRAQNSQKNAVLECYEAVLDPLDTNANDLKNPLLPKNYEFQVNITTKKKNWATFGEAFCQYYKNLDKKEPTIKKIGPKSVKTIEDTKQNAGIFDLVAKDRDKGDPPVNPPVKSPLKRRLVTTLLKPKYLRKRSKRGGGSMALTSREPGLEFQSLSFVVKATPNSSQNLTFGEKRGGM